MRASRLLSILILLQLRVRLTAEALADEFEVSVRTIYRDIDELSAAGVPIQADRGPGGGFELLDGYRTKLTGLGAEEAEAVFMIGLPGAAQALGLGKAAATAGRKLLASLSPSTSEFAGRLGARFHLDPVEWYRAEETTPHLPAMARAVLDQRVVTMTYESWTGVRQSTVEPLGLVLKAGAWYVVAKAGKSIRIYRASNIREQSVSQTSFGRPSDFDLPAYWKTALQRFETSLRPGVATLRVSKAGRDRISRLGAYAARAASEAGAPEADGWAPMTLPIESVEQAALALLGIGPEVQVLEPRALRERLRELAQEVARLHE